MRKIWIDKNENAHIKADAIEFSRKEKREPSALRTLVIVFVLDYKGQDKADNESVRIQSALREIACEHNSRGLKVAMVKI